MYYSIWAKPKLYILFLGNDIVYSISGSQYSIGQYHYTLETQSAVCIPTEDGLDLYPSSQSADHTQIVVSQVLNIPEHKYIEQLYLCNLII